MDKYSLMVSMAGDATVVSAGSRHPEEPVNPGEVAPPWNACRIPDCRHDPCPAKLRAWAYYGQRYTCRKEDCDHRDCAARRRAQEDGQPFGIKYDGPALPQHVVTMDGAPLGPTMRAIKVADGSWRLMPTDTISSDAGNQR